MREYGLHRSVVRSTVRDLPEIVLHVVRNG
jgi:hypothetical protein